MSTPAYAMWVYLLSLLFMQLSRLVFYVFNQKSLDINGLNELLLVFWHGMRFDMVSVALFNLPFLLLLFLPFVRKTAKFMSLLVILVMLFNAIPLTLNLMDVVFFRFISKRTTFELFQFFGNPNENTSDVLRTILFDFWYMLLILMVFLFAFYRLLKYVQPVFVAVSKTWKENFRQSAYLVLGLALTVLFLRGGTQLKPLNLMAAARYTQASNIPLLINTPFSILKTINRPALAQKHFYSEEKVQAVFSPFHKTLNRNRFIHDTLAPKPNFVLLILESFGRDYIGYYNSEAPTCTPFLDSLLQQSITFKGYANGRRSIEALPSVFGSLPSLMDIDFPSSAYAGNHFDGLGSKLKALGYQTAFFHGGNNGTMNFDLLAKAAGIDAYFGRNEYADDRDFDQQWGIYDEPFLQFTASELNAFQQPFMAGIFTLSSHHPYSVPPKHVDLVAVSKSKLEASIRYTDRSLRSFFHTASAMPWFTNTVFVILADHTPEEVRSAEYRTRLGVYAIPLAFYFPGKQGVRTNEIAQQTDIAASCLALTNDTVNGLTSFGRNVFDSLQKPFVVNYISGVYQYFDGKFVLQHDGQVPVGLFSFTEDPNLEKNLLDHQQFDSLMLCTFEAILQQYNNRMINNTLYYK